MVAVNPLLALENLRLDVLLETLGEEDVLPTGRIHLLHRIVCDCVVVHDLVVVVAEVHGVPVDRDLPRVHHAVKRHVVRRDHAACATLQPVTHAAGGARVVHQLQHKPVERVDVRLDLLLLQVTPLRLVLQTVLPSTLPALLLEVLAGHRLRVVTVAEELRMGICRRRSGSRVERGVRVDERRAERRRHVERRPLHFRRQCGNARHEIARRLHRVYDRLLR